MAAVSAVSDLVAIDVVVDRGADSVVMLLLGDDEDEVKPAALVAVIENVYAVPAVNPVTVIGDEEPVAVMLPGLAVTV